MWKKRDHIFDPTLNELTGSKNKRDWWHCTAVEQAAFEKLRSMLAKEPMLNYPDFVKYFVIHGNVRLALSN